MILPFDLRCSLAVVACWLSCTLTPAQAASPSPQPLTATQAAASLSEPPIDLGQTSFLDGEGGPGPLIEFIGNAYSAAYVTDPAGHIVSGTNKQWNAGVITHLAYVTDIPVLDGHLGGELLFPAAVVHLDVPGAPVTTQGGVGDLTFGPLVQWSDLRLLGRPFSMRLGLQITAPTGGYSPHRLIDTGQNAWQISPYYAFTWRATDRWEISARPIYDRSWDNDNPPSATHAGSAQAGDQFAMNLSESYAVTPDLRIGVASYMLRQISDKRLNDTNVVGSRQQVFGAGPGLLWSNGRVAILANAYREFAAENRPEGFDAVIRLLAPF